MGNYMSCALAKAPGHGHGHGHGGGGKCARVILPDPGGVKEVQLPATAAEVMMDSPGHFLVDARGLGLGARLDAPLHADVELQLGAVYATFPMKRRNTPLAAADVARLAAAAAAATATTKGESRRSAKVANAVVVVVVPAADEAAKDAPACRLRLEEMVDDAAAAAEIDEMKHRASNARSRRPTLDTIEEENYMSSRYIVV